MEVYATRDSVAAGDDADAPHARSFSLPAGLSVLDAIARIAGERYLPSIVGGKATWSVASGFPIAVLAQQWPAPRAVTWWQPTKPSDLERRKAAIALHFSYHAQ